MILDKTKLWILSILYSLCSSITYSNISGLTFIAAEK